MTCPDCKQPMYTEARADGKIWRCRFDHLWTDPVAGISGRYISPVKGQRGGDCNRRSCQQPGAVWFNSSTRKWYCRDCAQIINRENRETLCVEDPEAAIVAAGRTVEG